jgi:hypothetical protein
MRRFRWLAAPNLLAGLSLLAALGLMMAPAGAALLPDGGVTAPEVANVLQHQGYKTEIATDKEGNPLIRSAWDAIKFGVFFYNCNKSQRCTGIQYAAGFRHPGVDLDRINTWNRTKRFGRAYLDLEGDPWVEMDIDVQHGATTEALANDLARWNVVLTQFSRYIGR